MKSSNHKFFPLFLLFQPGPDRFPSTRPVPLSAQASPATPPRSSSFYLTDKWGPLVRPVPYLQPRRTSTPPRRAGSPAAATAPPLAAARLPECAPPPTELQSTPTHLHFLPQRPPPSIPHSLAIDGKWSSVPPRSAPLLSLWHRIHPHRTL